MCSDWKHRSHFPPWPLRRKQSHIIPVMGSLSGALMWFILHRFFYFAWTILQNLEQKYRYKRCLVIGRHEITHRGLSYQFPSTYSGIYGVFMGRVGLGPCFAPPTFWQEYRTWWVVFRFRFCSFWLFDTNMGVPGRKREATKPAVP